MTYRLTLMSMLLACSATPVMASEPPVSIVVSDQVAPVMPDVPDVTVQGGVTEPGSFQQDKDVYQQGTDLSGVAYGDCNSCATCGHCGACGACVGRLFGFGCEDGCCLNTCNMPQHHKYYPADHGYYYFIPYNSRTIIHQQQAVTRYGGDPRNPYDNSIFETIYEGLEPDDDDAGQSESEESPSVTPDPPPMLESPETLDPPAEAVQPVMPPSPAPVEPPVPLDVPSAVEPPAELEPPAADPTSPPAEDPTPPTAEPAADSSVDPFSSIPKPAFRVTAAPRVILGLEENRKASKSGEFPVKLAPQILLGESDAKSLARSDSASTGARPVFASYEEATLRVTAK